MTHQKRLKNKLVEFQEQLVPLQRRRVYSEQFEDEVREIVEAINVLITNNPIFHTMTTLVLPKLMPLDWSEDDSYEEAYDKLKIKLKECQLTIKSAIVFLDTHPAEEKTRYPYQDVLTPVGLKTKQKPQPEATGKSDSIGDIRAPIPFTDIKISMNRRELGIFLLGIFVGIILTISSIFGINFLFG